MSVMPPEEIMVPQQGGPEQPPEGGGDPSEMVRQAMDLLRQALEAEPDDEDTLLLEKMTTMGQQYLASQQKLEDTAVGAGPGVKFLRKKTQQASGGGAY